MQSAGSRTLTSLVVFFTLSFGVEMPAEKRNVVDRRMMDVISFSATAQ
jgi:hypothetical protein